MIPIFISVSSPHEEDAKLKDDLDTERFKEDPLEIENKPKEEKAKEQPLVDEHQEDQEVSKEDNPDNLAEVDMIDIEHKQVGS